MHNSNAIHDAVAMAVRVVADVSPQKVDGLTCRAEQIAIQLADRSVWQIDCCLIPMGKPSLSFRAAAWSLKRERVGRRRWRAWRLVSPATAPQAAREAGAMV